jgi:chromosomal replication initiation ATPase DnaA
MNGQLTLSFVSRPAYGQADFVVAAANRDAVAWIDRWPAWPSPALVLWGPAGCGKSHLVQVWRARSGAGVIAAADVTPEFVFGHSAPNLAIEDVDRGRGDEQALLALYRRSAEAGGHVLITARVPPSLWTIALADLGSRLRASHAVAMKAPDDELLAAIATKMFADRQLRVGQEVVAYLLSRTERSVAALAQTVDRLDAMALVERREITVALARSAVESLDQVR